MDDAHAADAQLAADAVRAEVRGFIITVQAPADRLEMSRPRHLPFG
jgi:hypothetical protein